MAIELGHSPKVRIIRMRKVPFIDSTGIYNLENLCKMSRKEHIDIVLSEVNENVHRNLKKNPRCMNYLVKKISVQTFITQWQGQKKL